VDRWTKVEDAQEGSRPSVVTLGNFDGVHRGHQAVLRTVAQRARRAHLRSVAVTFDPHPVAVLHPERAPAQITGPDYRMDLMEQCGLDATLTLPFTREFAQLTPEAFVQQVLLEGLNAAVVVVGGDTRFGIRNSGDVQTLRELGRRHGFDVDTHDVVGDHVDGQRAWSSSGVRAALAAGDVSSASKVLGRLHRVSGHVVHGHHRGRELGYPTANLGPDSVGMVPADGVYAGWLERLERPADDDDRRLPAAISVGTNPTFTDVMARTVEAYVLDRADLDLYGEMVGVDFMSRLRGNTRFDSMDDLARQMARDVSVCRSVLLG